MVSGGNSIGKQAPQARGGGGVVALAAGKSNGRGGRGIGGSADQRQARKRLQGLVSSFENRCFLTKHVRAGPPDLEAAGGPDSNNVLGPAAISVWNQGEALANDARPFGPQTRWRHAC